MKQFILLQEMKIAEIIKAHSKHHQHLNVVFFFKFFFSSKSCSWVIEQLQVDEIGSGFPHSSRIDFIM